MITWLITNVNDQCDGHEHNVTLRMLTGLFYIYVWIVTSKLISLPKIGDQHNVSYGHTFE